MTPHEKALAEWKANNPRRKGTASHYANGKPRVEGKTQAEIKAGIKAGTLNTSGHPAEHKALTHYKTDTSHMTPKKKVPDWAGDIGRKHLRNQKAETDKGYREDYR